jgi:hypothetical protein
MQPVAIRTVLSQILIRLIVQVFLWWAEISCQALSSSGNEDVAFTLFVEAVAIICDAVSLVCSSLLEDWICF